MWSASAILPRSPGLAERASLQAGINQLENRLLMQAREYSNQFKKVNEEGTRGKEKRKQQVRKVLLFLSLGDPSTQISDVGVG